MILFEIREYHNLKHVQSWNQLLLLVLGLIMIIIDFNLSIIMLGVWLFDFIFYPKYKIKNKITKETFIVKRSEWKQFIKEYKNNPTQ